MTIENVTFPGGETDLNDLVNGTENADIIDALDGDDTVLAGGGDDVVNGGDGDDSLLGEEGDDTLIGDRGADEMFGGDGNDRMIWNNGDGSDLMEGDDGADTAEVNGSDGFGDTFRIRAGDNGRVDFARTNFGNFSLDIGTTEYLEVNGNGGDDVIRGGNDLADLISLKLYGGNGEDDIRGSDGDDLIRGGNDNDVLAGAAGDDVLIGDRGDDIMKGNAGNDRMIWNNGDGSDVMNGGAGWDTAEVNGSDGFGDTFRISAGENRRVEFARTNFGEFTLDIGSTEMLEVNGGGGDDVIKATSGLADLISLELSGGAGNDRINGGDGDDYIGGGDDDDVLIGAAGDDTLVGGRGADVMNGNGGNDRMIWNNGDGSDVMNGGAGWDTAEVNGSDGFGDTFRISAGENRRVEFARTNFGEFTLDIGSTEMLEVNGGGGDDVIKATSGLADLISLELSGGAGNDRINGGDGDDYIEGGDDDDVLIGAAGDDTLVGGRGGDVMNGNGGNDRMIWNNGDGSDVMNGGAGRDTAEVNGSDSSGDVFRIRAGENGRVDFARTNFGEFTLDIGSTEVLEINAGGGNDFVRAGSGLADLITLDVDGGAGNDTLIGSDGADWLGGGEDHDVMIGGAGNDTLVGGRGNDIMEGNGGNDRMIWNNGDGSDIMDGGAGRDVVEVNGSDSTGDVFEISVGEDGRVDFARTNFGNFTLDIGTTEMLEVNGGGGDDVITASTGTAGVIGLRLSGGEGNDTITGADGDDRIDGGAGDDLMTGGTGADIFIFGGGADRITDFEQGSDIVRLAGDLADGFSVEDDLAQVGDDVVLTIGSDSLTFANQSLADFTAEDFLF